jgi:hypothetical protein
VAIFTTKLDAENQSSNLAKIVIRSTEPPLLPNPCYAFVVLFGRGLFVCGYCCLGAVAWWLFDKLNVFWEGVGKSLFTFKLYLFAVLQQTFFKVSYHFFFVNILTDKY